MEVNKVQESLFIETNKGYLELNGIINIKGKYEEGFNLEVKTTLNVQASFILRGCFNSLIDTYQTHYFKFVKEDKTIRFEAEVNNVHESMYYDKFNLKVIEF